jgi:hypothetical protein
MLEFERDTFNGDNVSYQVSSQRAGEYLLRQGGSPKKNFTRVNYRMGVRATWRRETCQVEVRMRASNRPLSCMK